MDDKELYKQLSLILHDFHRKTNKALNTPIRDGGMDLQRQIISESTNKLLTLITTEIQAALERLKEAGPKKIKKFDYTDAAWCHGYNDAAQEARDAIDTEIYFLLLDL